MCVCVSRSEWKTARDINTKLGTRKHYDRTSACIDPVSKKSKVKIMQLSSVPIMHPNHRVSGRCRFHEPPPSLLCSGRLAHEKHFSRNVPGSSPVCTSTRLLRFIVLWYLSDYCVPVAGADTRRHLRSANHQLFAVPHFRLNTYGRRAFQLPTPRSGTLSQISSTTRSASSVEQEHSSVDVHSQSAALTSGTVSPPTSDSLTHNLLSDVH